MRTKDGIESVNDTEDLDEPEVSVRRRLPAPCSSYFRLVDTRDEEHEVLIFHATSDLDGSPSCCWRLDCH